MRYGLGMKRHSKTRLVVYWSLFVVLGVSLLTLVLLKNGADSRRDYQAMRDNLHSGH